MTPFESPDVPDVYETVKISELSFYWAKTFASSSHDPFLANSETRSPKLEIFILNDLAKLTSSDSRFKSNTITFLRCIFGVDSLF